MVLVQPKIDTEIQREYDMPVLFLAVPDKTLTGQVEQIGKILCLNFFFFFHSNFFISFSCCCMFSALMLCFFSYYKIKIYYQYLTGFFYTMYQLLIRKKSFIGGRTDKTPHFQLQFSTVFYNGRTCMGVDWSILVQTDIF